MSVAVDWTGLCVRCRHQRWLHTEVPIAKSKCNATAGTMGCTCEGFVESHLAPAATADEARDPEPPPPVSEKAREALGAIEALQRLNAELSVSSPIAVVDLSWSPSGKSWLLIKRTDYDPTPMTIVDRSLPDLLADAFRLWTVHP